MVTDLGVSHNLHGTVSGSSGCPKCVCVCVCVHPKSLIDPDDMWHQRGKGTEQPVSYPQSCKDATANLICFHCIIHKFIQNLMWFVWAFFVKYLSCLELHGKTCIDAHAGWGGTDAF